VRSFKQDRRIQALVDRIPGHKLTDLAIEHLVATEHEENDESEMGLLEEGIFKGLRIAEITQKRRQKWGNSVPKDFGAYIAVQETSDGEDILYFVGSARDIIKQLKKIEENL
jgi:hypothetical protein